MHRLDKAQGGVFLSSTPVSPPHYPQRTLPSQVYLCCTAVQSSTLVGYGSGVRYRSTDLPSYLLAMSSALYLPRRPRLEGDSHDSTPSLTGCSLIHQAKGAKETCPADPVRARGSTPMTAVAVEDVHVMDRRTMCYGFPRPSLLALSPFC